MSTVDDAIEAGARALSTHWRDMHTGGSRVRALVGTLNDDLDAAALSEALGGEGDAINGERHPPG